MFPFKMRQLCYQNHIKYLVLISYARLSFNYHVSTTLTFVISSSLNFDILGTAFSTHVSFSFRLLLVSTNPQSLTYQ